MRRVSMRCYAALCRRRRSPTGSRSSRRWPDYAGLVATDDEGQVVGYVAFSPVIVQGEELQWVGMAPLAVDENYRGQGLARQLVYEGWIH